MPFKAKYSPRSKGSTEWTNHPLKKIIYVKFVNNRSLETLECGHQQYAVQDFIGETSASKRRCRKCKIHEENNE